MFIQTLTNTVRADLWPGALVGLSRSLLGLPEDTRISGPGGHATATQIEASLSQTGKNHRQIHLHFRGNMTGIG